jgi:hypothetical protein
MLVGRCSWELSGRKLYRKIKKSQTPGKPRDLQFRGPLLETRNTMLKQNCHLACPGVPWDRGVPEFPATLHWKRPRVRLSVKKAA